MIRAIKLIALIISGAIIFVFLFMIVAPFFGWHFDVVPTGSMEPVIMPGGLVISRPAEPKDISLGEVILFREQTTRGLICHRVIDVKATNSGTFFQTKGDANKYPDPQMVSAQNLVGKLALYIPRVGQIAYSSNLGKAPVILFGKKLSSASILIIVVSLTLAGVELRTICKWIIAPESQRYQERLRKRKERLRKRKKAFRMR